MVRDSVAARFGRNLRACRTRARITQEELGVRATLHRTEIGLLERGERVPRIDTLLRLIAALSVTPDELLGGIRIPRSEKTHPIVDAPESADEDMAIEVGLLSVIFEAHPEHLSAAELVRRMMPVDPRYRDEDGAVERAIRSLQHSELVRETNGVIVPTRAALRFDELPF
ncbi:MAG TPA: helix-turn-helix transcriptional regulator [Solirubrobacterales bacterium]